MGDSMELTRQSGRQLDTRTQLSKGTQNEATLTHMQLALGKPVIEQAVLVQLPVEEGNEKATSTILLIFLFPCVGKMSL